LITELPPWRQPKIINECYHAQVALFIRALLVLAASTEIEKSNAAKSDESQNNKRR
jgi:hypothetical protein